MDKPTQDTRYCRLGSITGTQVPFLTRVTGNGTKAEVWNPRNESWEPANAVLAEETVESTPGKTDLETEAEVEAVKKELATALPPSGTLLDGDQMKRIWLAVERGDPKSSFEFRSTKERETWDRLAAEYKKYGPSEMPFD